jgi:hypothetical protein
LNVENKSEKRMGTRRNPQKQDYSAGKPIIGEETKAKSKKNTKSKNNSKPGAKSRGRPKKSKSTKTKKKQSKPKKKSKKQLDKENADKEIEREAERETAEELGRYENRLVEELKQGIILNEEEKELTDVQVDECFKQLIKGVTKSPSIASNKVINSFIKLCKNMITQNQNDQAQVWEDCKEFLLQNLRRFDDQKSKWLSSDEIIKKLEQENILDYWVERKFYSMTKTRLEGSKLPDLDGYNELDYYCNELIFDIESENQDTLMMEQRKVFLEIINLLFDIWIVVHKKLTEKENVDFELGTLKESLKEADIKRIKTQIRLSNPKPSLKVQKKSIKNK